MILVHAQPITISGRFVSNPKETEKSQPQEVDEKLSKSLVFFRNDTVLVNFTRFNIKC